MDLWVCMRSRDPIPRFHPTHMARSSMTLPWKREVYSARATLDSSHQLKQWREYRGKLLHPFYCWTPRSGRGYLFPKEKSGHTGILIPPVKFWSPSNHAEAEKHSCQESPVHPREGPWPCGSFPFKYEQTRQNHRVLQENLQRERGTKTQTKKVTQGKWKQYKNWYQKETPQESPADADGLAVHWDLLRFESPWCLVVSQTNCILEMEVGEGYPGTCAPQSTPSDTYVQTKLRTSGPPKAEWWEMQN